MIYYVTQWPWWASVPCLIPVAVILIAFVPPTLKAHAISAHVGDLTGTRASGANGRQVIACDVSATRAIFRNHQHGAPTAAALSPKQKQQPTGTCKRSSTHWRARLAANLSAATGTATVRVTLANW